MIDYDTMAEAVFRERALIEASYRAHQGAPAYSPVMTTLRQRVAGLLVTLASWLAPAGATTPTTTTQHAG